MRTATKQRLAMLRSQLATKITTPIHKRPDVHQLKTNKELARETENTETLFDKDGRPIQHHKVLQKDAALLPLKLQAQGRVHQVQTAAGTTFQTPLHLKPTGGFTTHQIFQEIHKGRETWKRNVDGATFTTSLTTTQRPNAASLKTLKYPIDGISPIEPDYAKNASAQTTITKNAQYLHNDAQHATSNITQY